MAAYMDMEVPVNKGFLFGIQQTWRPADLGGMPNTQDWRDTKKQNMLWSWQSQRCATLRRQAEGLGKLLQLSCEPGTEPTQLSEGFTGRVQLPSP